MAQITPSMVSEMRKLRGMGLSLQKIASQLSEKHGIPISHQTVSYHLGKVKKDMLEGKKSVRVIHVQSMDSGPRVFNLDPATFEKERIEDSVYQNGNLVYELRSGCMHCTTLPNQANSDGEIESFEEWAPVFLVGADPNLPQIYRSLTNITDAGIGEAFHAHKTRSGINWLSSKGYSTQIFQDEHVSNRLSQLLEGYYNSMGNEAVRLSGNTAKDILTLHSIYGSMQNMQNQLKSFVRPDGGWWNNHFDEAFKEFMKETGIPPGRRKRALTVGCLDNKKLNRYYDGNFKDWDQFESAILVGFSLSKEWTEAVKLQCLNKKEYDSVKKYGWPSGPAMRQALESGFKHKEANLWSVLQQRNLLRYPEVVKWIRKDPSELDRIEQFPSMKALQLHDAILGGVYKSELVVTGKILEKYNSMSFPGPNFHQINQIEALLQDPPFSDFCDVDIEAGSVILNLKTRRRKKAAAPKKAPSSKANPAIDSSNYTNLINSETKMAKRVMKEIGDEDDFDVEEAFEKSWKWTEHHMKKLWRSRKQAESPRGKGHLHELSDFVSMQLSLSKKNDKEIHNCVQIRNDLIHGEESRNLVANKNRIMLMLKICEDICDLL